MCMLSVDALGAQAGSYWQRRCCQWQLKLMFRKFLSFWWNHVWRTYVIVMV